MSRKKDNKDSGTPETTARKCFLEIKEIHAGAILAFQNEWYMKPHYDFFYEDAGLIAGFKGETLEVAFTSEGEIKTQHLIAADRDKFNSITQEISESGKSVVFIRQLENPTYPDWRAKQQFYWLVLTQSYNYQICRNPDKVKEINHLVDEFVEWPMFITTEDVIRRYRLSKQRPTALKQISRMIKSKALPPYDGYPKSENKGWVREKFLTYHRHRGQIQAEASLGRSAQAIGCAKVKGLYGNHKE